MIAKKGSERMAPKHILVIEDEKQIARFLELELRHAGYSVSVEGDGALGLQSARRDRPDLVLLDLMLPGMDGFEVCSKLREFSLVPILMLTAKDATEDKVSGLDCGADDYITKPFEMEELLARIRAAFRRKESGGDTLQILMISDLSLDAARRTVRRGDSDIALTKREFDLLEYLLRNSGLVLTREQILDAVWGMEYGGDANVVDVYIRYLRSKLDEPFPIKLIHTVRGVGYTLEVREQNA